MPTIYKPKRNYNKEAGNPMRKVRQKFYQSQTWRDLRLAHLMEHPLCEICELQGITRLAAHVHHLRSWTKYKGAERDAVATDPSNLASLCATCHWHCHHGDYKGCKSLAEIASRLDAPYEENEDDPDDQPETYVF